MKTSVEELKILLLVVADSKYFNPLNIYIFSGHLVTVSLGLVASERQQNKVHHNALR